jgi:hypothetical protein
VGFRVGRAHRSRPAFAGATRLDRFSRKFTHNPLKSPNSDEGFQGNPRESKSFRLGILSFFLGVLWTFLDWLGLAWGNSALRTGHHTSAADRQTGSRRFGNPSARHRLGKILVMHWFLLVAVVDGYDVDA